MCSYDLKMDWISSKTLLVIEFKALHTIGKAGQKREDKNLAEMCVRVWADVNLTSLGLVLTPGRGVWLALAEASGLAMILKQKRLNIAWSRLLWKWPDCITGKPSKK